MASTSAAEKCAFLRKPLESEQMQQIEAAYGTYIASFKPVYDAVRNHTRVDNDQIQKLVKKILQDIEGSESDYKQFMLYGLQGGSDFNQNAVNVAVISALLGQRLELARKEMRILTTGALLHDLGMQRIPPEILSKTSALSSEEQRLVQTYPVHSYKIITGELSFPDEIGLIALQHQERWSGGGYPRNLSGKSIDRNARIVAVADSFEAMLSKRPYRNSMDGYEAVRAIIRDNGQRFDPEIIKVFIRTFGIYPRGCLLLLNNGSIGRVLDINSQAPLRPLVKIMIDPDGNEYANDNGPEIDMRTNKHVFVVKAINPEQFAQE